MPEHVDIESANAHEPKHITTSGTADAGKVITPSDTSAGTSELRLLTESEISEKTEYLTLWFDDLSTATTRYVVAPFAGTLTQVYSVIQAAITGADCTLTVSIDGVNVNPATITITQSGSAAGDVDSVSPTTINTFSAGDKIEVATDGGDTAGTAAMITLVMSRS